VEYLGEFIDLPTGGRVEKKRLVELKHFDHEPTWEEIQEQMKLAQRCKFVQLRGKNNGGLPRLRNWENPHFLERSTRGRSYLTKTEIAIKVGKLREKLDINEIAKRLGVCWRTIYYWWDGEHLPQKRHRKRLLRLFNYHACSHAGDHRTPERAISDELNPDKCGVS